jgi:tetratricopeptide (TPR) repeat protein
MASMKRKINVFLASSGDLSSERACFKQTIRELNTGFGDGANIQFIAKGWEDCHASYGRRSQSVINELIDDCEIFILAMYKRWGQEAVDAYPSDSYTEEEFQRAQALYDSNKAPRIFAFFKNIELNLESNPDVQLEKVLTFKRQLEETKKVIHRSFNDETSFKNEVEEHLRAYVKGELPDVNNENDAVIFPIKIFEEFEKEKKLKEEALKEAIKAKDAHKRSSLEKETLELEMAEDAALFSKQGKIEYARQKFAKLTLNTKNKIILFLGYEFFYRISDFKAAERILNRALKLAVSDKDIRFKAEILGNLGNVYRQTDKNVLAKEVTEQAFEIFTELGETENKAISLQSLGAICFTIGDIQAENYYKMALNLFLELKLQEGTAVINSNLGEINARRGEYPEAKDRYEKALSLYQELDHVEGIADQLGKLAVVYLSQGKDKEAEAWLKKALAENIKLGRNLEIVGNRHHLGIIYLKKADYPKAEKEFNAALEISTNYGFTRRMVDIYGNLGNLYAHQAIDKSEFEVKIYLSEKMYKKALAISEELEYKPGVAIQKHNLGTFYLNLREMNLAEPLLFSSLEICEVINDKEGIASSCHAIANLYLQKGQVKLGIPMAEKAMAIFVQLQSPHAEITASLVRELKA